MDELLLARLPWLVLGGASLIAAVQLIYLPTMTEGLRCQVFSLRRALFLGMARGRISRDSEVYQTLRELMNTMLLYAEEATFGRALLHAGLAKVLGRRADQAPNLDRAIQSIGDVDTRKWLGTLHNDLWRAVMIHALLTSPVFYVALPFLLLAGRARSRSQDNGVSSFSHRILRVAETGGMLRAA